MQCKLCKFSGEESLDRPRGKDMEDSPVMHWNGWEAYLRVCRHSDVASDETDSDYLSWGERTVWGRGMTKDELPCPEWCPLLDKK